MTRHTPRARVRIAPRVFLPAAVLILAFVVYSSLFTDHATAVITTIHDQIIRSFGWYYIAIVSAFVIFAVMVGVSRFGDIPLGRDDEEPEFRLSSWLAMLFAAGMGIGLVFWGVAEPLSHFASPRPGVTGDEPALAQEALIQSFLHWGLHPWAIYVIVGLSVAYAVHRRGRPVSIRWALEPLLGRFVRGWLGDLIDIVAIVGTLFGVSTSLGLGVLQIAEGLHLVAGVTVNTFVHVMLIAGITAVAVLSVVSGVSRGIKWLSNLNVSLMLVLLVFVLITGPTLFMLREFVQSIGLYLQNLFRLSFDVSAGYGEAGAQWSADWTVFYWGWWMAWAPFVGVFIARISRGRTVREFVVGVLLVPTVVSFLWFSVLGGAALHREVFGAGGLLEVAPDGSPVVNQEGALFGLLETLPAATAVSVGVIVLITLFFITSSDSGSLVVDMLATGGDPDPPTWSRVFWGVLEGAVALALLVLVAGAQGLETLQTAAIMAALPVSVVMILMCVALWPLLRREHLQRLQSANRQRTRELTEGIARRLADDEERER